MKVTQHFTALAVAVLFCSCATTGGTFRIKETEQQPIARGQIEQVNKIAEYRVDPEKVDGLYTGDYDRKVANSSLRLAKELAVGNAVSQAKCDFLVGPMYDVNVDGKNITVKVSGYPAHYIEFKTYTSNDSTQVIANQRVVVPTTNTPNSATSPENKKKTHKRPKLRKIGIGYGIATAIVAIIVLAGGG